MARTIDEHKERYYQLVLKEANKIYSAGGMKTIPSKQLVAKANEYAFSNRLKTDVNYRFRALAFTVALSIRVEKRYSTFLRKLFLLFAYLRERAALQMLKRVFGARSNSDIREIVSLETEKIILLLSQREDDDTTGGGKRSAMGDVEIEEALNSFFEECVQDEQQKTAEYDLSPEKSEQLDGQSDSISTESEDAEREKISVDELESKEQANRQKNSNKDLSKAEQSEKEATKAKETDPAKNEKAEKPVEKSAASISVLAEGIALEQENTDGLDSPFPIFREKADGNTVVAGREDSAVNGEKSEAKPDAVGDKSPSGDVHAEGNRENSLFPVFGSEKTDAPKSPEKVETKESVKQETVKQENIKQEYIKQEYVVDSKSSLEVTAQKGLNAGNGEELLGASALDNPNLSDENRARIELNVELSEMEILAMTEQLKAAANLEMQQTEQEWREKISVADSSGQTQLRTQEVAPASNQGTVTVGLKK